MSFLAIRKGERRDTWAAFLTLFALVASHSVLETARDALFLAKVPAARLPWVFMAIALLSFAAVRLQTLGSRRFNPRRALSLFTLGAGGVTFGFFSLYRTLGSSGLYALYVWSGLVTTTLLVHFWALVGELFTITQAKRLYGFIGAGSVLGAIAGSGLAGVLSRMVALEKLLLVSAIGFSLSALAPALFGGGEIGARTPEGAPKLRETLAYVAKHPYARRVAGSLFVATVCLTIGDFIFKSTVAALVPRRELGTFLGTVYFAVNVLSLVCQLGLVAWVIRRATLGAALAVLPALLAVSGLGIVASGGLVAVLAVKAADGALRYSLHRTAAELLFLPFGDEARRRVKGFVDVLGQRGGQVLASVAILGFTAVSAPPRTMAIALVVLASLWVASAMALRRPYIELFRTRLNATRLPHLGEFPELDVASLETLIAALESENDSEVIAALDILEREGRAHLVPALILYHPSEQVVVRALATLTRSGKKNLVQVIDRVLDHPSPVVRAATIAARSVLEPDAQKLLLRLSFEESADVRAAIVVNLIASGEFTEGEVTERVDSLLKHGTPATKIALAEAIARRSAAGFHDVLIRLSATKEVDVRCAALAAMAATLSSSADQAYTPELLATLVGALSDEATRSAAEQILAGQGKEAFDALLRTFEDVTTYAPLRWRIPHALGQCNAEQATQALLEWLPKEPDGSVRYQIIRALEQLVRRHPTLSLDKKALGKTISATVTRAFRYLDRRLLLARGAAANRARKTPGHELLSTLFRDKEANAKGRLFRLLGLLHPGDDFGQIYRGLSLARDGRATSMELIESILEEPLKTAVLGLVDDGADELRLRSAGPYHAPLELDYEALLQHLSDSDSESVREVTLFHARELGLVERLARKGEAA